MLTTSRWLIVAGYVTPIVLLAVAWLVLPANSGQQVNDILLSFALVGGLALAGILFLAGAIASVAALLRSRDRFRWYDYALLAGAVAPLMGFVGSMFWPG